MPALLLSDQVAAPLGSHLRGVNRAGRHIEALTGFVGFGATLAGDCHLAVDNDMRGLGGMRVVGIMHARAIFPDVGVGKAFGAELFLISVGFMLGVHVPPLLFYATGCAKQAGYVRL